MGENDALLDERALVRHGHRAQLIAGMHVGDHCPPVSRPAKRVENPIRDGEKPPGGSGVSQRKTRQEIQFAVGG